MNRYIWRPSIPLSSDGLPLTVSVKDFYPSDFPYDRLATNNKLVALSMRPEFVLLMVLGYICSSPLLKFVVQKFHLTGTSTAFRTAVAVHNLALAVFSAVVAIHSWAIVLYHLKERGFEATYCDQDGSMWESGFGAWAIVFYMSKYWEFVDTWILILKGKKPSFLQVYHHSGIAFAMWGAVTSHSAWQMIAVLLNSVIHTLMYTYFFIKTIYPSMEIKAAKYLTTAQIAQFVIGIVTTQSLFYMGDACDTPASRFSCAFLNIYGLGLIALFVAFAKKKYTKVKKA